MRAWYERRTCYRVGHKTPALVAVMRKAAKALWHLARGEAFDPAKFVRRASPRRSDCAFPATRPEEVSAMA